MSKKNIFFCFENEVQRRKKSVVLFCWEDNQPNDAALKANPYKVLPLPPPHNLPFSPPPSSPPSSSQPPLFASPLLPSPLLTTSPFHLPPPPLSPPHNLPFSPPPSSPPASLQPPLFTFPLLTTPPPHHPPFLTTSSPHIPPTSPFLESPFSFHIIPPNISPPPPHLLFSPSLLLSLPLPLSSHLFLFLHNPFFTSFFSLCTHLHNKLLPPYILPSQPPFILTSHFLQIFN